MDPSLPQRMLSYPRCRPEPGDCRRAVALFNHPRFQTTASDLLRETGFNRLDSISPLDLNHLANPPEPVFSGESPGDAAPHLSDASTSGPAGEICRADVLVVGIDPTHELPPMWKVVLWFLFKSRRGAAGWLVCAGESGDDCELTTFLDDLATLSNLELIRRCPTAPGAAVIRKG